MSREAAKSLSVRRETREVRPCVTEVRLIEIVTGRVLSTHLETHHVPRSVTKRDRHGTYDIVVCQVCGEVLIGSYL